MDRFRRADLLFDVVDQGPSGGPVVVLLHGFPQAPETFSAVTARLHAAGLRTIVPAQRGYTASARPTRRRDYRLSLPVGDLLALLDAAQVARAHVVGHDWGGATAWAAAAWHPSRVSTLTVLSTPHPAALWDAVRGGRQAVRSSYVALFQLPVLPELVLSRTLARTLRRSGLPEDHASRYADAMAAPGALRGALGWYRGMPFSGSPRVGRVRVPTTYVWGRHDPALGRVAAERTEHYVRAPYELVELEAGHWLPEVEPDAVARAVLGRVAG